VDSRAGVEEASRATELRDRLLVAEFQRSIHTALAGELETVLASTAVTSLSMEQRHEVDALTSLVLALKTQLKTISELYLQATEPYKLWDQSLHLLHAAKSDDFALLVRLWRSVIYRIVPARSNVFEIKMFLDSKRSSQFIDIDFRYTLRRIFLNACQYSDCLMHLGGREMMCCSRNLRSG
jgi:hypothetical protein